MRANTRGEAADVRITRQTSTRVRMCRAAGCARRADSGAVPGFCLRDADVVLTFRRFLGGHAEFSGDGLERARPEGPSFDAIRRAWTTGPD